MTRYRALALCLVLPVLAGCHNDEISSYRVPKTPQTEEAAPASPAAGAPKGIEWTTPKGWREVAATDMRVGSFLVDGKNGLTADVSIVRLGGPAGGELANVNRWRGQLGLAAITEAELPKLSVKITPGGRPMLMSNFVTLGPVIDKRYKKRMLAVTCARAGSTWFFKMMGEDALVASLEPAFLAFLKDLRFND